MAGPACGMLIVSFALSGCGARKVQPVIVRESVTVRQPAAPTVPPPIRRAVPPPRSAPNTPPQLSRDREAVGVTGLTDDVPLPGDAGHVSAPEPSFPEAQSAAPPPALPGNSTEERSSTQSPLVRDRRHTEPALLLAWVAIAATLCGWGVHLRRGARSREARARRAA